MTKTRNLSYATALMLAATAAHAEGGLQFDGTASVSYKSFSRNDDSQGQLQFNLESDVKFSEKFSLGFDYDNSRTSSDGMTLHLTRFQLEPTLHLANGAYVGTYFQNASISMTPIGLNIESFGVFGGYDAQVWSIDGYIGDTSVSALGESIDSTNIGATFTVRANEKLNLYAHLAQADIVIESRDSNIVRLSAFGADYAVQKHLSVYGAMESISSLGDSIDGIALGAAYDLAGSGLSVPGTVTIELGQGGVQDMSVNIVTVGWIIPLGNGTVKPLNSMIRTAQGGTRSPLVTAVMTYAVAN